MSAATQAQGVVNTVKPGNWRLDTPSVVDYTSVAEFLTTCDHYVIRPADTHKNKTYNSTGLSKHLATMEGVEMTGLIVIQEYFIITVQKRILIAILCVRVWSGACHANGSANQMKLGSM